MKLGKRKLKNISSESCNQLKSSTNDRIFRFRRSEAISDRAFTLTQISRRYKARRKEKRQESEHMFSHKLLRA